MDILSELFARRDEGYAAFQRKLMPTIDPAGVIGVRVPALRALAKTFARDASCGAFLATLPHTYYDENLLHALVIAELRDYDTALAETERFLPYVDNWAVCDIFSPRVFCKHKAALLDRIRAWVASPAPYTCRFGIEMLMRHFLDDDFAPSLLEIPAAVQSEEYYVRMMVAWFFATALAKQWEAAVPYVEGRRLDPWTHAKTISKARESYRLTDARKAYLLTLK